MSKTSRPQLTTSFVPPTGTESPYLSAALAIAQQLVREAVPTPSGITWEGDDLSGQDEASSRIVRGPVGPDLYSGAAGIAWFLGHMAQVDSSTTFANVAVPAFKFALSAAKTNLRGPGLSLFAGAVGVALAAVEVADRLGLASLRRSGLSLAKTVGKLLNERQTLLETDLIGGIAGVVIGLLAIHRRVPEPLLLQTCNTICERLIHIARREWWGCSWPEPDASEEAPALCGLAHGVSGIGWALAETAWATGDQRFLACATEAFHYERSWFSPERCAWPDLREPNVHALGTGDWPGWMAAWCHGALGIGAVRLRFYEVTGDMTALAEASAAIQAARSLVMQSGAALRHGQFGDVTLCHGLGGAVELFLLAHEIVAVDDHQRAARRVGDLCLDIFKANSNQWPCGLRKAERAPGLFLGLAGIGATMLRLHNPLVISSPILPGRYSSTPAHSHT